MLAGDQWLEDHLEAFVKPRVKVVPELTKESLKIYPISTWTLRYLKALHAIWKEAKKRSKGREMLLAGRDVFLFEVLARLEGYHTIFRPDISGQVARGKGVKEHYTRCYLLDTGYAGSVPKALGIENFDLIAYRGMGGVSPTLEDKNKHQVFPRGLPKSPISSLAAMLETVPKYWTHATLGGKPEDRERKIVQGYSHEDAFRNAAIMTRYVAASVGHPKAKRKVMSIGRGV